MAVVDHSPESHLAISVNTRSTTGELLTRLGEIEIVPVRAISVCAGMLTFTMFWIISTVNEYIP